MSDQPMISVQGAQPRRAKALHDTAGGCRDRALADLASAASTGTQNVRLRFERSAAAWTQRADMIQRLDESFEARRTAASAIWAEDEGPPSRVRDGSQLGPKAA